MAKHPTSSRVHRKDQAPDDAFVAAIKRSYAWGKENTRLVTILLFVVLIAGAGGLWYATQQRELERQAAARLSQVQQSVASGNVQLAIRDLRSYLDRFGSTRTAGQARLILASILLGEERTDEALDALGNLPHELDRPYGLPAARIQAAALEEVGRVDEAVNTYLRIADNARFPFQRREALADAARVHMQNGDPRRAVTLYQRVVATFDAEHPQRGYYEMYLAEARAEAEQGDAGPATTPVADTAVAETG